MAIEMEGEDDVPVYAPGQAVSAKIKGCFCEATVLKVCDSDFRRCVQNGRAVLTVLHMASRLYLLAISRVHRLLYRY